MKASRNTRQGYERGHEPRRHIGVLCVASRHISTVPLNGPDCLVEAGRHESTLSFEVLLIAPLSQPRYFGLNLAALDL